MKRDVILNPQSRNGRGRQIFAKERQEWEHKLGTLRVHETCHPGEATRLVQKLLNEGDTDQILVAGGDGTLHEVLAGFWEQEKSSVIRNDVPVGIINLGTGGDFHRTVREQSDDYVAALVGNRFELIDVGKATAEACDSIPFLNITSVGMAGQMLKKMKSSSFQGGSAAYLYHSIATLIAYQPQSVNLEWSNSAGQSDGCSTDLINAFVCNGKYSGGGMKWAPNASLRDGKLRVTVIQGRRKLPLIVHSKKVYAGNIEDYPGASTFEAKSLTVSSASPISMEADGEVVDSMVSQVKFEVEPGVFPLIG